MVGRLFEDAELDQRGASRPTTAAPRGRGRLPSGPALHERLRRQRTASPGRTARELDAGRRAALLRRSRRSRRSPRSAPWRAGAPQAPAVTLPPAIAPTPSPRSANPNYRRYFSGQSVSLIGTWMQTVAQWWLVLQLTGSGTAVGLVVALQTLPVLLLGPYGGVVADRVDKRRLMIVLQSMMGGLALVLGVLTLTIV